MFNTTQKKGVNCFYCSLFYNIQQTLKKELKKYTLQNLKTRFKKPQKMAPIEPESLSAIQLHHLRF
jgi:hypothetical protein